MKSIATLISQHNGGPAIFGDKWLRRFKKRNPEVHTKKGVALDTRRATSLTQGAIQEWYDGLQLVVRRKFIKPQHTYNVDEIGTALEWYRTKGSSAMLIRSLQYYKRPIRESGSPQLSVFQLRVLYLPLRSYSRV